MFEMSEWSLSVLLFGFLGISQHVVHNLCLTERMITLLFAAASSLILFS